MPSTRTLRVAPLLSLLALALALFAAGGAAAAGLESCAPGSGKDYTHTKITQALLDEGRSGALRCANLAGADLAELSVSQLDLTGANLTEANLSNDDLGQATLNGADLTDANLQGADLVQANVAGTNFTNADLQHAKMGQAQGANAIFKGAKLNHADMDQAELQNGDFEGADLGGVSLIQATLTHADFDHANLGGVDFTQAELGGASFHGAKGLTPWSMIIAILAGVVFLLFFAIVLKRASSSSANVTMGSLGRGLVGAVLIALSVHLGAGGMLDTFVGAFGVPVDQTCNTGPLCTVGVQSGVLGLVGGIFLGIAGLAVFAMSRR